jgi:AraC-like DNA-binding protein
MEIVSQTGGMAAAPAPLARGEQTRFFTAARFDGLECMKASFRTHRYARHAHDTYVIGGTHVGSGVLTIRGTQHYAAAGHLTLFNPHEVHDGVPSLEGYSYCATYPSVMLLTAIAAEVSGRADSGTLYFPEPVVHDPHGLVLVTAAHRALEAGSDALAADELLLRAYGYCLARHAHIVPAALGCEMQSVARVKEFLGLHYAENLTLTELAAEAGLSRYHLIRTFQHTTGLTPHAYLVNCRIEAAKGRLRRGDIPAEIAATTGFSDQAHLTRVFKAHVGITPGAYRAAVAP